jgi:S-adenosylmethionine:tRNA ribosyltransferase-isomerase
MFDIEDYNYELPEDLIAQVPASNRDSSRLFVLERQGPSYSDRHFYNLPTLLKPGDLLVVNNTKVIPAKLLGRKESGGRVEILVLEPAEPRENQTGSRWCLLKSSKRPKIGNRLFFDNHTAGMVEDLAENGMARINFDKRGPALDRFIDEKGSMPLPPYIKRQREDNRSAIDRKRYQTVFSRVRGAVAAPTAGLHFTDDLIESLKAAGIAVAELTLHVGYGTFKPVRSQDIRNHRIDPERFIIDQDTADLLNQTKEKGGRVVAVGTTVVRALETVGKPGGRVEAMAGEADLMILPGHPFHVVDAMITNFHLPKSSLLFLVAAFSGLETIKVAYRRAVRKRYRFYSYGDAMLIL